MADDYTPTTEEVKFEYAMHKSVVSSRISEDGEGEKLGKFFDEFDRWLTAHDAEKRAEWEAETEWEYECSNHRGGWSSVSAEHLQWCKGGGRRRKVGPWMPINGNGETNG